MQQVVRRPRVFVSSTIADFRDLRGAIRYWLEQAGYDVQLSEYTDFDRRPEEDVFQACFNNIKTADHYILLIGGRRGSWYDQDARVSVTQQEFRVAHDSGAAGTNGVTVLVRSETETALRQWDEDGRPEGSSLPDRDLGFTASFLAEVRQPAAGGTADRWTYNFSDFGDVVDALRVVLRVDTNIERRLAQRNLLDEILYNIGLFLTKWKSGTIGSDYSFATRERDQVKIMPEDVPGETEVPAKVLGRLGTLVFSKPRQPLRHRCMSDAIERGLFLQYDPNSKSLQTTVEHEALVSLRDDILEFEEYRRYQGFDEIDQYFVSLGRAANDGRLGSTATVDSEKLALLVGLHDRMDDVFKGLVKMSQWLVGSADAPVISRRPVSPIEGMSEQTEAERVSTDELRWALESRVYPFGEKLTPNLREVAREVEGSWFQELRSRIPSEYMDDAKLKELISESMDKLSIDDFAGAEPPARRALRND